jgi:uncharacterized protein
MPLLTIPAADIDAAGRSLEADLPVAWLDENLADCDMKGAEPGHVVARLSRSGNDIVVRGRVRATVRTACARCLEPARIDVDTELSLLLQPGQPAEAAAPADARRVEGSASRGAPKGRGAAPQGSKAGAAGSGKKATPKVVEEEHEFSSEEAEFDTYDGETVVLDGFVREAILLEMPIFPLCSEGCPGIRPAPEAGDTGSPAPVDPRLAPLGALRAVLPKAASGPQGLQVPEDDKGAAPGPAGAPDDKRKKE